MSFTDGDDWQNAGRDYKVGYGRPPEHSRFGRGQIW